MAKKYDNEIWVKETNAALINELEKIVDIKDKNNTIISSSLNKEINSPIKIKKLSLNVHEGEKHNKKSKNSINNNIIEFENYLFINNIKMKKEEYESLKKTHNNLEDNSIKLTHTFKENTLAIKSIKLWENKKKRIQNKEKNE